jgi:hypothetical protein
VILITRDIRGWGNIRKEGKSIHNEKLSCGWKSIARCAQTEILTKCQGKCSEEPEEVKSQEGEWWKYSREEFSKVFTKG